MGRLGSFMPDRARSTASATSWTASSCPDPAMKYLVELQQFFFLALEVSSTGIPVHLLTISKSRFPLLADIAA